MIMKSIKLLFILLILSSKVWSNIAPPQAHISEIYINSLNAWSLELGFYYPDISQIDSIIIETESGSAKLTNYSLIDVSFIDESPFYYLSVISNNNLNGILEINRENDFVIIHSYIGTTSNDDYLAFGLHEHSNFLIFPEGHSLSRIDTYSNDNYHDYSGYFSLDNTPSLGEINLVEGVSGIVSGYLYDIDHNPMPNTEIMGYVGYVSTDENGYYNESVLSRSYFFDTITIWTGQYDIYIYETDTVSVFPDSTHIKDLILISYPNSIIEPDDELNDHAIITNFPNPCTDITTFFISIPDHVSFKSANLEIYNNIGQTVFSYQLRENKTKITLPSGEMNLHKPGMYHYSLIIDGNLPIISNTLIKL